MSKSFNENGIKAVMAIRLRFVDQEGTKQLQLGDYFSLMNNSYHDGSRYTLSTHINNFETAKIRYERCADEPMSDVVYKSLLLNSINHYAYCNTRIECTKDNKMDFEKDNHSTQTG